MPAESNRPHPARILLVDDNNNGLIARKRVLEEHGHSVTACTSPHKALERCTTEQFDVVITDFKMPEMNGAELIRRIHENAPRLPVILLSGFTEALGLNEMNTGASAVIQKSASEVQQLLRAVHRVLHVPLKKPPLGAPGARPGRKKTQAGS